MDRRDFIKLTAITGTSATIAGCGVPQEAIIRFVPDEDLVPGVAEWKPSVCPGCAAGCGVLARVMEADVDVVRNGQRGMMKRGVAKKLEGNPAHPVNRGGLCARGQASIQITYHPDRLTQPLKRTGPRGSGQFEAITWDDALAQLVAQLDALADASSRHALAFVTRPHHGHRGALIDRFLAAFGAPPAITFEVFDDAVLRRANELSFGHAQLPTYDLAESRYIVSFGTDFLGTWNSPVANNAAYGRMRQGRPGERGTFVQIESRLSQTGANADEWIPIKPGTEGVLALGLARIVLAETGASLGSAGPGAALIPGWSGDVAEFTSDRVSQRTGVPVARIERLAHLMERSPSLAIIGGAPLAHTNGLFAALAVNALNALLGTLHPTGVVFTPRIRSLEAPVAPVLTAAPRSFATLVSELASAAEPAVRVLLVDGADPVFGAPVAWRLREALDRVPFIASFASFIDDTTAFADLILPDHSFLESWVDAWPESGSLVAVAGVAAPAMRPLYNTRATPDVLLDVAKRLKRPLNPPLPWSTFEEMLNDTYSKLPVPAGADDAWTAIQKQGGWWERETRDTRRDAAGRAEALPLRERSGSDSPRSRSGRPLGLPAPIVQTDPQFDGAPDEFPFYFHPYPSPTLGDGSMAHLPWLQELPDPLTTAMWSSWVEINPDAAERLGLTEGDVIEVASRHGSVQAPVVVSPGIAPDLVAMPVGQGHRLFTRVASGRGVNPLEILAPMAEPVTGALAWAATRVKIRRMSGATGRLILFAGGMRERPHENER